MDTFALAMAVILCIAVLWILASVVRTEIVGLAAIAPFALGAIGNSKGYDGQTAARIERDVRSWLGAETPPSTIDVARETDPLVASEPMISEIKKRIKEERAKEHSEAKALAEIENDDTPLVIPPRLAAMTTEERLAFRDEFNALDPLELMEKLRVTAEALDCQIAENERLRKERNKALAQLNAANSHIENLREVVFVPLPAIELGQRCIFLRNAQTAQDVGFNGFAFKLVAESFVRVLPRIRDGVPVVARIDAKGTVVDVEVRLAPKATNGDAR